MRMNAVLSNPKHPEYGQFTVPLPIPHNQYNGIMEALNAMDMGDPLARDCQMDEILGEYPILKRLEGKPVNIDELDYLAKRLDSFCYAQEGAQFQGAAVSYDYSDMTDLINLTFSCQQVTVITDFSDLEQVGRDHYMVLNGGCASKEELDALDGYETALLLIDEGNGVITPYGVVYDNGMRLSQLYDGRHFPQYFYEPPLLTLTVQQSKDAPKTWLYLPAPDLHIKRSLVRAGIVDPADMRLSFQGSEFPDAVDCVLDMESECLEELNKLCQAIKQLSTDEIKKLGAVVEYARPETAAQVRQLAENLEQFDYAPGVQNVEEYGRYMIQKSGRFEYDENLRDYYDYARYGLERMNAEEGRVVKSGYVSYHGVLTLEELMMDNPAEQYGYLKADLKAVVDEVVDELAKDPRVAAAYNLWYELREDVLRTYKDNLPERLPLSGQKEFKRIKNLVILEAVKLEQYQQVFHPDDLWDGNPDEHAEEAQLFVYEQMNQSMSHPPEAAEAGQARTQYALGKIYRDGQGVEKDVQKAVELFTLAAMQGNSFAAFALGKMYLSDDPALSRNVAAALKWITNAAEHGNQFAQYYLGKLLLKGTDDISQDTNSALRWLLASVEQGNVHAEYALAMAYLKGESVPKDSLKAMELLKRASSREHQFAQYQLGKLLLQGEDVPKDVVAAVHWLTASAMHGNQYAQYALGKLYLLGKGVEKDKDRAAKWFQMAANQGNEYAQYYLKHMDDPMGQSPAAAVITLFHSLANIFREQNQLPSGGIMVAVDRKLLRKIKAKKIAQGHKADDHEPKIGLQ